MEYQSIQFGIILKIMDKIKRLSDKANYNLEKAYEILDENTICHISFIDQERPMSIPMAYWRVDNYIYFHAANKGRFEKSTIGKKICVSIAQVKGFVLARSAFEHTYNYSSVVMHGVPESVDDEDEKIGVLQEFVNGLYPNRWDSLSPIKDSELRATKVLKMEISNFACKVRSGGPDDSDSEWRDQVWAGHIPLERKLGGSIEDGESGDNPNSFRKQLKRFES